MPRCCGDDETPVEFVPPDGLRPGQIGTLVDFKANPLDVTATIVDLAVRGYLTIEELHEGTVCGKHDWTLTRSDKDADELLPYEQLLLDGLFRDGDDGAALRAALQVRRAHDARCRTRSRTTP